MKTKHPADLALRWIGLLLALAGAARTADGAITGSISHAATRNLLEGARVEIAALGLSALTDNTGRYVLAPVPAGVHDVAVSYIGLDTATAKVAVGAGQRAVRDFELGAGIYRLAAFKVTGEREGDALAITAQRNADNVKNIVAMDSFGNLPNMSAGEAVLRLPGVAGSPTGPDISRTSRHEAAERRKVPARPDGRSPPPARAGSTCGPWTTLSPSPRPRSRSRGPTGRSSPSASCSAATAT